MKSRKNVLDLGAAGPLSLGGTSDSMSWTATAGPLIDNVRSMCRRLGAAGWREMLLDVTDGAASAW
jgi:hypothetical protein